LFKLLYSKYIYLQEMSLSP